MLVKTYKLGNTTIEIHDDAYKDKTPEDIEKTLNRIADIGRRALYNECNQKQEEEQAEAEKA